MKKLLTFIFSAVLAISAAAFAACEDIEDRAMQSRIINAWLDDNPDTDAAAYELSVDVRGVYGDTYVFYLNGPFGYAQALTYTFIDNVYFAYPDFQQLEVYNDGEIYTLEEAFDAGFLTHENLLDIQKKYAPGVSLWKCLFQINDLLLTDDLTHYRLDEDFLDTVAVHLPGRIETLDGKGVLDVCLITKKVWKIFICSKKFLFIKYR